MEEIGANNILQLRRGQVYISMKLIEYIKEKLFLWLLIL